jgi:hypothetical protein
LEIDVVFAVDVVFDRYICRKIEIRVEGARAVSTCDTVGSRELEDVVVASPFAIETSLDAVAFTLDVRESNVDVSADTGYIETSDV